MPSNIADFLKNIGFGNSNDPMCCPFAPLKNQNENPENQNENPDNQTEKKCFYKKPLFFMIVFMMFLSFTGLNLYLTNFMVNYLFTQLCMIMFASLIFGGLDNGVYHLNYFHCKLTDVFKNMIRQTLDYGIAKWKSSRFYQTQDLDNPKQD